MNDFASQNASVKSTITTWSVFTHMQLTSDASADPSVMPIRGANSPTGTSSRSATDYVWQLFPEKKWVIILCLQVALEGFGHFWQMQFWLVREQLLMVGCADASNLCIEYFKSYNNCFYYMNVNLPQNDIVANLDLSNGGAQCLQIPWHAGYVTP